MPPHIHRRPIRFHELDSAGIVFYPRFFEYFHICFEDFFGEATGVSYPEWIRDRRIGWPTVHIESDYFAPLRYGMTIRIEMSFEKLGRSSFVVHYELFDDATGTRCAASDVTVVSTDLDALRSIETPAVVRAALLRHAR